MGFTPGPAASAWPARACRHFTRVGIPPAEIPSISGTSPYTARSDRYASCAAAYAAATSASSSSSSENSRMTCVASSADIAAVAPGWVR